MLGSKASKKRIKAAAWLDVVAGNAYLFAGVLCHIAVLILLSVVLEFHAVSAARYESLLDLLAIIGVIGLVIVLSMRWTYPMSNEEPLIILLVWILLSSRITATHCFCCRPPAPTGLDAAALAAEGAVVHHHAPVDPEEVDFMLAAWQLLVDECRAESFNFVYSLLCVVLVLASFLTELRSYWVSLLFRLVSGVLLGAVVLLLIVSPSLCSKFSIRVDDGFATVARITLFNCIWWINHYRRATERLLESDYAEAALHTTERLATKSDAPQRRTTTPRGLFLYIAKLVRYLDTSESAAQPVAPLTTTSTPARHPLLPLARADDELRGLPPRLEPERAVGETLAEILAGLAQLSHAYSSGLLSGVVSWKNRAHSKHVLHLLDLAHTVWLLVVCPHWLLLAPLEILWLLYYVRLNTCELYETRRLVALQGALLATTRDLASVR